LTGFNLSRDAAFQSLRHRKSCSPWRSQGSKTRPTFSAAPVPLALRMAADHCALHAATQQSVEWLVAVKTPPMVLIAVDGGLPPMACAPGRMLATEGMDLGCAKTVFARPGPVAAIAAAGRMSSGRTRIFEPALRFAISHACRVENQGEQPERTAASSDCHVRHCFLSATAPACIGLDREVSCAHGWSARISSQSKNF
jgi:hypothetical protein